MSDEKITELPSLAVPAGEDVLPIVDDPSGVAVTKQISVTNLLKNIGSETIIVSDTLEAGGVVTLTNYTDNNVLFIDNGGVVSEDNDFTYNAGQLGTPRVAAGNASIASGDGDIITLNIEGAADQLSDMIRILPYGGTESVTVDKDGNWVFNGAGTNTDITINHAAGQLAKFDAGAATILITGATEFDTAVITTNSNIVVDSDTAVIQMGDTPATDYVFGYNGSNAVHTVTGALNLKTNTDGVGDVQLWISGDDGNVAQLHKAGNDDAIFTLYRGDGVVGAQIYAGDVESSFILTGDFSAGTIKIGSGSVTDSSGSISFGNENLSTTGTLGVDNAATFNASMAAVDLRVATDNASATLFVQGSTDRVGIGTNTPSALFSVGNASQFQVDNEGIITLATGGSLMSADGILTLGGTGEENILLDFVTDDNEVTLSSNSGVTLLNTVFNITATAEITANVFDMPTTASATVGVINQNNGRFIHTYGTNNLFIGPTAGNFTMTGTGNTGIGSDTLNDVTTGIDNTCIGVRAGNQITEGFKNFAMGFDALNVLTTGSNNVAIGHSALNNITTGGTNVAIGRNAGLGLTVSSGNNVIIGNYALDTGNSDDIDRNTIIGTHAAGSHAVHASKRNVIIGYATGALLAGDDNIFIGYMAGRDDTGSGKLMIDNVDRTSEALGRTGAIIYGVMDATPTNQTLTFNASVKMGDSATPNYLNVGSNGDVSFIGTSGFYPRTLNQASIPAAGTGATQIDSGEMVFWADSDDGDLCYLIFNFGGTVYKKVMDAA